MWELTLPFLGFLATMIAVMIGVGGGVFFVPLLTLAFGLAPANAAGTSLMVIIFGGLSATLSYSRHKLVFFKIGILLALASIPGSLVGAYLTSVLSEAVLGTTFGVFLIVVATRMIYSSSLLQKKNAQKAKLETVWTEPKILANKKRFLAAFGLSFFGGLLSSLLGIGGGLIFVPLLSMVLFLPIHVVVATSMFMMVFTSLSGAVQHWTLGNVSIEYGLLLAMGAIVGAQAGSWMCKRVSGEKLQLIFAVALIILSFQMILKFL